MNTSILTSRHYDFIELVSSNDLTQSWLAIARADGHKCFVKVPSPSTAISLEEKNSILKQSYECQKSIRSQLFNIATSRRIENGKLFVEYPYLDRESWNPLTAEFLQGHLNSLITEICLTLDLLHLLGLAHADVKLENFQFSCSDSKIVVKLADLDFLRHSGSSLNAKILGTPGHIAPEVLENDSLTCYSDNYSLGISLTPLAESSESKLKSLLTSLTDPAAIKRPAILLDALLAHGIIDKQRFEELNKRLLAMLLICRQSQLRKMRHKPKGWLQRFLQEVTRVYGIPSELLSDLETVYSQSRCKFMSFFKYILKTSAVERIEDYWHIGIPDNVVRDTYAALSHLRGFENLGWLTSLDISEKHSRELQATGGELSSAGQYLKSYTCLKTALDLCGKEAVDSGSIETALAHVAGMLGRPTEAAKYYRLVSSNQGLSLSERLRHLRNAVFMYLHSGESSEARDYIAEGLSLSENPRHRSEYLEFARLDAWIDGAFGEISKAKKSLHGILQEAQEIRSNVLQLRLWNDLGTLEWREGDFITAEQHFLQSLKIAEEGDLQGEASSTLSNLGMLGFELLYYGKSIKYSKHLIDICETPIDASAKRFAYKNIMLCHARLGEFRKASYWHQRYRADSSTSAGKKALAVFILDEGWIALARADLRRAEEHLLKAVRALIPLGETRDLGKAYYSLTCVAMYRSGSDQCAYYVEKASSVFENISDKTSLLEVQLIEAINSTVLGDGPTSSLVPYMQQLVSVGSFYPAALGLFYFLISSNLEKQERLSSELELLYHRIKKSKAPLCKAISYVLQYRETKSTTTDLIPILKSVYTMLYDAGYRFEAMLLSEKIAGLYSSQNMNSVARKFLMNSMRLATELENNHFAQVYEQHAKSISTEGHERDEFVRVLEAMCDLVSRLDDFDATLTKLIKCAVDFTGAERGALLLRRGKETNLLPRAHVNCDKPSLSDIAAMSKNVASRVAATDTSLVTENAVTDDRTKKYPSIITHNILSVVCVPIFRDQESIGALYLDHHTIPALFEPEDVSIVSAIARFISQVITTSRDFRTAAIESSEHKNALRAAGSTQVFVTKNQALKSMFADLPQIAQSGISVLLTGESGTGKEILSDMIHDLSGRSQGPLVKLNCAALSPTLVESELFGVVKGAATGVTKREGKLSAAEGGTLLLDEIGDMPLDLQAKLLRVLEQQHFEKVGSNKVMYCDVRFIYATNKDLPLMVKEGKFRNDLYHRINKFVVEISPLRERPEDIPLLADHFSRLFLPGSEQGLKFTVQAMDALMSYSWPGNARELRNLIERYCILRRPGAIGLGDLPAYLLEEAAHSTASNRATEAIEKEQIRNALASCNWNQTKAARLLQIPIATFRRKVKKYGLRKPR